jgi:hypothetical protein
MIIDIYDEKPFPWYKRLYFRISMYLKWNCILTRNIYWWYSIKFGKDYSKWTFPIITNYCDTHPLSIDLVSIQPMNEPPGQIFYLDYIKEKQKWWQFWKK